MRAELVGSMKPVDRALVGDDGDMFRIVLELKPDIIALGFDQHFKEQDLQKELEERGLKTKVVRLSKCSEDLTATRKIIQRVIENFEKTKKTVN